MLPLKHVCIPPNTFTILLYESIPWGAFCDLVLNGRGMKENVLRLEYDWRYNVLEKKQKLRVSM